MTLSAFVSKYIRELADQIVTAANRSQPNSPNFTVVWGVVNALHTGPPLTISAYLRGNAQVSEGICYLGSYAPTIGDVVMCLKHGKDVVCLGAMSPVGGGGFYASLTGAGETATPGDLEQRGNLTVNNIGGLGSVYIYIGDAGSPQIARIGPGLDFSSATGGPIGFNVVGELISLDCTTSASIGDIYITPKQAVRMCGYGTPYFGIFNKAAAPVQQQATPVTLADVIALLQAYGWSA